ncbi:tetratricopeptide repeat protein [Trinickia caryophylli]|nr:tetratricopeptide repeat protein [Trinickia caryophylli]
MTGQPEASAAAYGALLATPLAARGYRGLGLLAAAAGHFDEAARHLAQAAALAPTDAATLSDLGYARLRAGDVAGSRVPLMQSAELDSKNARVLSNLALLLLAEGRDGQARALMEEERFPALVRDAIRQDAQKVAAAERARRAAQSAAPLQARPAQEGAALVSLRPPAAAGGADVPPSLLQRFAR